MTRPAQSDPSRRLLSSRSLPREETTRVLARPKRRRPMQSGARLGLSVGDPHRDAATGDEYQRDRLVSPRPSATPVSGGDTDRQRWRENRRSRGQGRDFRVAARIGSRLLCGPRGSSQPRAPWRRQLRGHRCRPSPRQSRRACAARSAPGRPRLCSRSETQIRIPWRPRAPATGPDRDASPCLDRLPRCGQHRAADRPISPRSTRRRGALLRRPPLRNRARPQGKGAA